MEDPNKPTSGRPQGLMDRLPQAMVDRLLTIWQVVMTAFFVMLLLGMAVQSYKLSAPSAPAVLFWSAIGVCLLVTVAHLPPVLRYFPPRGRGVIYVLSFLFLILLWPATMAQLDAAWERTPQGAVEAKQAEIEQKAERVAEQQRLQAEATVSERQAVKEELEDLADEVEACFSVFGGGIPALKDSVRSSLHDPDSFKHVETVAIVPDSDQNNVAMTFRATNGFGGVRTGVVKALVNPNNCEVVHVSEPEVL